MKKLLVTLLFLAVSSVHAETGGICKNPMVRIVGSPQMVFSYRNDRCNDNDTSDTPAMAFKDASGKVHLFNGYPGSFMSVGTTLNNAKHICSAPFFSGSSKLDALSPQSFDNLKWLRDPWTEDGKTVYALVHNEFHGWEIDPDKYCPSRDNTRCWYPNLLFAKSTDSGKNFSVERDANGQPVLAITTPYTYKINGGDIGHQIVIEQQTNIVPHKEADGKMYYYILAVRTGEKENHGGNCLLRTDNVANPAGWRAWDGKGFNIAMNMDPYKTTFTAPEQHICKIVLSQVGGCTSWTYNTVLKQYVAICSGKFTKDTGERVEAFMYALSKDMFNWSKPKLLREINYAKYRHSRPGSGITGQAYPSMLDANSTGLNFTESGRNPYLYFTRFNPKVRHGNWHNRDVLRSQLEVSCGD